LTTVSNSTPLIWLSRIGRLGLLRELFGEVHIPASVYREVVEAGLEQGYVDAHVVKQAVDEGWIVVVEVEVPEPFSSISSLHLGEAEALYHALEGGSLLLMDEAAGRSVARAHGVAARGTMSVLVNAVKEGLISREDARQDVLTLVESRFRISAKVLKRVLMEIERLGG